MIRAKVIVGQTSDLMQSYNFLRHIDKFEVIKVSNNLKSIHSNVVVSVIFDNKLIAEIELKCGSKPVLYHSYTFLKNLASASDVKVFKENVLHE